MLKFRPNGWHLLRALAAVVAGAVLAACVAVTVPKLPQAGLPAHWRNADTSPALGPAPDLTGWWKAFNDPELDALVGQALADNLDVAQAVWKLRAARVLEAADASQFKPQLAFNTIEQPNPQNTASYFQAGFDATWEFGLFGRLGASRHLATAAAGAAAAELQDARVSLVAEVVREYLQLRAAQRSEMLLADAARAAHRKLALLQVQERLQLASKLEVEQAAAAAASADAQLAEPRAAAVQHAQALALLLGRSEPDPAWLVPKPLPALAVRNVDSVPANLLRTRPEIRYAETQVLQAAGELGIAKAALYPHLALGSSLTFAAQVTGHTHLGIFNNSLSLGPIVNFPLFDWGRRRAVRSAREDQLQAALAGYRQAVLKGAAEVETDLAALHASAQRLHATDATLTASRDGLAARRTLQRLGEADGLQLADAKLALTDAELTRAQARLAHGLAFIALYKALGGAPLAAADDPDAVGTVAPVSPASGRRPVAAPAPGAAAVPDRTASGSGD